MSCSITTRLAPISSRRRSSTGASASTSRWAMPLRRLVEQDHRRPVGDQAGEVDDRGGCRSTARGRTSCGTRRARAARAARRRVRRPGARSRTRSAGAAPREDGSRTLDEPLEATASVSLDGQRGNRRASWNERPRPARPARPAPSVVTSRRRACTWPASARVKPQMRSNSVVLPAPFGPMMPTISPVRDRRTTRRRRRGCHRTAPTARRRARTGRRRVDRPVVRRPRDRRGDRPSPSRRRARRAHLEEHRPQQVGSLEQLGRRPAEPDLAALHEVRPLGNGQRDVDALLDQDDRRALARASRRRSAASADDHRGEAERQLVDQQHGGLDDERHAEREHLLLAAGQVGRRRCRAARAAPGTVSSTSRDRSPRPRPCRGGAATPRSRRFSSTVSDPNTP